MFATARKGRAVKPHHRPRCRQLAQGAYISSSAVIVDQAEGIVPLKALASMDLQISAVVDAKSVRLPCGMSWPDDAGLDRAPWQPFIASQKVMPLTATAEISLRTTRQAACRPAPGCQRDTWSSSISRLTLVSYQLHQICSGLPEQVRATGTGSCEAERSTQAAGHAHSSSRLVIALHSAGKVPLSLLLWTDLHGASRHATTHSPAVQLLMSSGVS